MSRGEERNPQEVPGRRESRPGRALQVLAVGLVLTSGVAGMLVTRWLKPGRANGQTGDAAPAIDKPAGAAPAAAPSAPAGRLRGWDRPDLVLVLSGSQHGYLLPCGCSHPQLGGLERRYNFVQSLRQRGWAVAAVDVGDVAQLKGPRDLANEQGLLKYVYSMRALKQIGCAAVSFGRYEAGLPLESALAEYALQEHQPRVLAANLRDRNEVFPEMVGEWLEVKDRGRPLPIRTGVTAIIGPTVAEKVEQANANLKIRFEPTGDALRRVLAPMRDTGVELRILLYQGLATNHKLELTSRGVGGRTVPKPEAVACAETFPQFQVVLAVGEEEEPSSHPILANGDNTLITSVGFKGRYVGVVGVWRTGERGKPFRFEYQLVEMGEDLVTPDDRAAGHPIITLIEEYTGELKRRDMLARFGQTRHPVQVLDPVPGLRPDTPALPQFIGSERCQKCHEAAYDKWKETGHSHAYDTLVKVKRPGNRQFDAECIVCHTTGFGYQTGFANAAATPQLKNVGCESCHGPGSHHAKNPNNKAWRARMSPWGPAHGSPADKTKRIARIDKFCQTCHDTDNDVNWTHNAFDRKWLKIDHRNPASEDEKEKEKR